MPCKIVNGQEKTVVLSVEGKVVRIPPKSDLIVPEPPEFWERVRCYGTYMEPADEAPLGHGMSVKDRVGVYKITNKREKPFVTLLKVGVDDDGTPTMKTVKLYPEFCMVLKDSYWKWATQYGLLVEEANNEEAQHINEVFHSRVFRMTNKPEPEVKQVKKHPDTKKVDADTMQPVPQPDLEKETLRAELAALKEQMGNLLRQQAAKDSLDEEAQQGPVTGEELPECFFQYDARTAACKQCADADACRKATAEKKASRGKK